MMNTAVQSSVQVQRIQAIDLTVSDLDRAIDFYTKALCFEVIANTTVIETDFDADQKDADQTIDHGRIRMATLKLGDEQIRLMQYLDRSGNPVPPDSHSNDLWFQHLAIVVSDMDRAYAHLQAFPFEAISTAPQTIPPGNPAAADIRAFKFRDPDRHPLELIWFPPDKGQPKWHRKTEQLFLGIDHTAIAIANTEQSLQFYRDALGMQVDGGSLNWRETQARMDGLPGAKVRVTALRPIQGGLGIELLDYLEPDTARPIPADFQPADLAYVQVELRVTQVSDRCSQNRIEYILQASNPSQPTAFFNPPSYRIQDPTGHFLMLIPL